MKGLFFEAIAITFASIAGAQSSPKEHSMTGCLEKAPDNGYMLTNVEGQGPKTVGIVSSSADLAPHVGHKIEVTGTPVSAKEAEAEKTAKAPHYMRLTAVKMIARSCP